MGEEVYPNHSLDSEMSNFTKVWIITFICFCYSYFISKHVSKPYLRLLAFIPIISLLWYLPLILHSMHLGGFTSFFIAWLANFKLLLLAFHKGPLSDPSLSLPKFISLGCFPIKIQQNPPPESNNKQNPHPQFPRNAQKPVWNFALKGFLVAGIVRTYDYGDKIHPTVILLLYSLHIYIMLELMLAAIAGLARAAIGAELEQPFNEPYLSSSLQDFWGRRWNIIVTRTLRPTVYDPSLRFFARIIGRERAPLPAVFSTFVVSALMHELLFYYLGRKRPTWEVTWFFLLHGLSLVVEMVVKKGVKDRWRWQLPRVVATVLAVGYVLATGFWLFFPALLRCQADTRAVEEYRLLGAFLKGVVSRVKYYGQHQFNAITLASS